MRLPWLIAALFLCALLAALHIWATSGFYYWHYPWLDVAAHYLGGLSLGALLVGLLMHRRPRIYLGVFAALAISWELFEYFSGIPRAANFVFDTSLDLLMDALGALTVYTLARTTSWR
ncbi:MAG: hypothetical protein WBK28_01545 [Minisyncoccia bacterium]